VERLIYPLTIIPGISHYKMKLVMLVQF